MFNDEKTKLFMVDQPVWHLAGTGNQIHSICYNNYGNQVALSSTPGELTIYSIYDGVPLANLQQTYTTYQITNCHFHPVEENLLLATSKDGFIFLYDILTGEIVSFSRHLGSNLLSMNIDTYGETFAIGCADGSIRIYDLENLQRTKALVKLSGRNNSSSSSLIYTLLYYPDDPNVIISTSGLDKILFWDLRTGNAERSLTGVHVHGQGSVDVYQNTIITASFRDAKQLEVYDFGTAKKIRDINYENQQQNRGISSYSSTNQLPVSTVNNLNENNNMTISSTESGSNASLKPANLNCVSIAKNGLNFVAGGAVKNQCQIFDLSNFVSFGFSKPLNSPVTSIAVSPFGSSFVCGTENGIVQCYAVRVSSE